MLKYKHTLFFLIFFFIYDSHTHREKEREAETQAEGEGEAGSMHWEPDVGFGPGSPGSRPGPKAGAKLLRHPGMPASLFLHHLPGTRDKDEQFLDVLTELGNE